MDATESVIEPEGQSQEGHPPERLQFRVSTGLKRVLGRELITDDEVAIFELVKNAFDADASEVYLQFDADVITIADDGFGMSYDDLKDKWLFVAYSAKRNTKPNRDTDDYRDQVADRPQFAGSKGIGRFSSDRLGQYLTLQTRPNGELQGPVHCLEIDWAKFEEDDTQLFSRVGVAYRTEPAFDLPEGIPEREHGTVIQIRSLLKDWRREDLLKLRSGLAKLINPFGTETDGFGILVIAKAEAQADSIAVEKLKSLPPEKREENAPVVNGRVGNFIFSTLQEKTTFLDVKVDAKSNTIETSLTDRGEVIYRIREPNPYPLLVDADFRCQLYFLNRAAKATFARRMGLPSVKFGSVFLFRNGFRVFPVGNDGDDWFGIDRRKQQGYARFLGTRDIIGRIDVSGSESVFQEASSRNQGLIEGPAVSQLRSCFREHCLKRLERYVVPVSWGTSDIDSETLAFIETDGGRARVAAAVADLIGSEEVEVLSYSKRLIDTLNERSDQFEVSLANLRVIATRAGDHVLAEHIEEAEERFTQLKRSEAEARRIADEERKSKLEAEARVAEAVAEVEVVKEELKEERKRTLFLTSITSLDIDSILDMHHLVTIYAADLQQQIENLMLKMGNQEEISRQLVVNSLEPIALLNRKILAVAKFSTKANFRLDSEYIEEDLATYITSYIENVAKNFVAGRLTIDVTTDGKELKRKFKPIDVSIVIDNLLSNARKARATKIEFHLTQSRKGLLEVVVTDDGKGLSPQAATDGRLFEKGFTTTDGSGLGLYHVRQVLGDMRGSIEVEHRTGQGASFLLRIPV